MLCLCTTLGQDRLTARLLVVPSSRRVALDRDACPRAGAGRYARLLVELAPALATELLPGALSLVDAITVLDQRAEALEALARRHELGRASLHGHLVTALRAGALNGEATLSAMFEKLAPASGRLSAHEAPRGRGRGLSVALSH